MKKSRQEYLDIRQREAQNKEWYQRDDGRAAPPHTICFSVNNNCYMRCKMCDIGQSNQDRRRSLASGHFSAHYRKVDRYVEFPVERLKELVDEVAPDDPIIKINFVEPLLYKGLKEIAEHVKDRGLKFYTITNGWQLKKNAPWLVDLPAELVRISLDGPEEVHDEIRGIKGSFARTMEGLREIIRLKKQAGGPLPILGVCCTISSYNYDRMLETMEVLDNEGILEHIYLNFNHLYYTTAWETKKAQGESDLFRDLKPCSVDEIMFEHIDTGDIAAQMAAMPERFDPERYHYYFSPRLETEDLAEYYDPASLMFPGTKCYLPWYAAQVSIDGEVGVWGHCMLPSMGNVLERGFNEVWNSERARENRLKLKEAGSFSVCNKCIGTMYPLRGRG